MPYREPGRPVPDEVATPGDDRVLALLLIVLGGLRVACALVTHEAFGAEATIAGIMFALGVALAA